MKAISLLIASLGTDYTAGRRRSARSVFTRTGSDLTSREVKILVRQFANNVRQLRRILLGEGLFQEFLALEILLLNEANCDTVRNKLEELRELMETSNLNSLILTTYSVKFTLLENVESLIDSKFSFRFWRMLPVWLRNIDKVMYGYSLIGSAGDLSSCKISSLVSPL